MNKILVSVTAFALLAGCTLPPRAPLSPEAAAAKAACIKAGPPTGSHIADGDDCGGYASGAVKRAVFQNAGSGSKVYGCPNGQSPC